MRKGKELTQRSVIRDSYGPTLQAQLKSQRIMVKEYCP